MSLVQIQNAIVKKGTFYCFRCSYEHDISGFLKAIRSVGLHDYSPSECKNSEIYNAIVKEIKAIDSRGLPTKATKFLALL